MVTARDFDYWADVSPISPPLGGRWKFAAKAVIYGPSPDEPGRRQHVITLPECYGVDRAEASSNADAAAVKWIAERIGASE